MGVLLTLGTQISRNTVITHSIIDTFACNLYWKHSKIQDIRQIFILPNFTRFYTNIHSGISYNHASKKLYFWCSPQTPAPRMTYSLHPLSHCHRRSRTNFRSQPGPSLGLERRLPWTPLKCQKKYRQVKNENKKEFSTTAKFHNEMVNFSKYCKHHNALYEDEVKSWSCHVYTQFNAYVIFDHGTLHATTQL